MGDLRWPHWARDVWRGLCWALRVCESGGYCRSSGWCGIIAGRAYAEQRDKAQGTARWLGLDAADAFHGGWQLEGSTLFTRGGGRALHTVALT